MAFPRPLLVLVLAAWCAMASAQTSLAALNPDGPDGLFDHGSLAANGTTSFFFGNQFEFDDGLQATDLAALPAGRLGPAFNFVDVIRFTLTDPAFTSIMASLSLPTPASGADPARNISNFQAAVFKDGAAEPLTGSFTNWLGSCNPVAGLGWGNDANALPGAVELSADRLRAGSYTLQIRGLVDGTAGGLYAGSLLLTPLSAVPEPARLALLLAGLGLVGWFARRRAR